MPHSSSLSPALSIQTQPRRRAWLGVPLLAVLAATEARAQMGGGMGGGRPSGPPPDGAPGGGKSACSTATPGALPSLPQVKMDVDERLNRLPGELGLNEPARQAFGRYALAVSQLMNDEVKRSQRAPLPGVEAVRAIDQQIDDTNNRMAAWEEILEASKALFAQLNPAQQTLANKRLVVSIDPRHWMTAPTSL